MVFVKHAFECVSKNVDHARIVASIFISNVLKYLNIIEIAKFKVEVP